MTRTIIAAALALSLSSAAVAGPVQQIVAFVNTDLDGAIALANGAQPPDATAATCFTTLKTQVATWGKGNLPATLNAATDYERLWLFHLSVLAVKADPSCQAICSRLAQITPLLAKITPSFCDALNLLK